VADGGVPANFHAEERDTKQVPDRNVLGVALEPCGNEPLTGFYRDGCCSTGPRTSAGALSVP
jgi:uncharacterized protein (DUF2237 family)